MNSRRPVSPHRRIADSSSKRKFQRGQALVVTLLTLTPILGIGALVIDLGNAFLLNTQMQHAADLASLAGVKSMIKDELIDPSRVRRSAIFTAKQNKLLASGDAIILDGDIELGFYDTDLYTQGTTPVFRRIDDNLVNDPDQIVNAVRVTVELADTKNKPLSLLLAKVINIPGPLKWSRQSISVFGILNAVLAYDMSNSMVWGTYMGPKACPATYYGADQREFKKAARALPSPASPPYSSCGLSVVGKNRGSETCFYYPTPATPDDQAQPRQAVMPQPATDIAESIINDFLINGKIFSRYYRVGIDFFETEAYSPHTDVLIAPEKKNNKQQVIDYLKKGMLSHWCEYAATNTRPPPANPDFNKCLTQNGICKNVTEINSWLADIQDKNTGYYHSPLFPWPAGLKFWEKGSGWTNIGNALNLALIQLGNLYATSGAFSYDVIFLLTDGMPTCERCNNPPGSEVPCCVPAYNGDPSCTANLTPFWCSNESETLGRALVWSVDMAKKIKEAKIDFFGVYFATNGSCADDEGWNKLQSIALSAGGKAFCAENVNCDGENCLRTILEELGRRPRFFLVPTS